MTEQEGVIKYHLTHCNIAIPKNISLADINAWRHVFYKLSLIGQQADRYAGFGYGNISQRTPNLADLEFIISGTQTGHIERLSRTDYCRILNACPNQNSIQSAGETHPSSEALTHASVYQFSSNIQAVIHVHSPDIWHNTQLLKLPYTHKETPYGTPEMAYEVKQLLQKTKLSTGIFSMLGHEDGIIAYSDSIEKAATILICYYTKSIALNPPY